VTIWIQDTKDIRVSQ